MIDILRMFRFLTLSLACSLFLFSCQMSPGTDGKDGAASVKYSWLNAPKSIGTNDPSFGDIIYNDRYEPATVGTWQFRYTAWDYSNWTGQYTLYVNKGTEGQAGSLFSAGSNGTDGKDIFFELDCYSIGPSFYYWDSARTISRTDSRASDEKSKITISGLDASPGFGVGEKKVLPQGTISTFEHREVVQGGDYTIVLEYSQLK